MVTDRLPAMCGSDTLTTVVSSTSMKVANITETAMSQGLMGRSVNVQLSTFNAQPSTARRAHSTAGGRRSMTALVTLTALSDDCTCPTCNPEDSKTRRTHEEENSRLPLSSPGVDPWKVTVE